ncbi:hypothetical protein [Aureibacter tunicatorum]|uniref:Glucan phosphoethanolaminetransferase (Alkaline phosphatase superfamily) n=1 Tax=Aureibacter tunicatorum TaxID=866807 RepID=A0AAE3XJB9_9BACT|nr:hypothetical protein [Aureibacter tunicatorum]MDR6238806.1 glucan phosphoethanolaminetransferase (alkaline phosphatase superfamily) [Aureibacter tunicatorum]BDD05267.1 hypothetical protein AUTU_27500 [Aureibacter tunicatorum]
MNKVLPKILLVVIIGLIQTFLMTRYNPNLIPIELFMAFGLSAFGLLFGSIVLLTDLKNNQGKRNSGLLIMFAFLIGSGIGFSAMKYQDSERRENANFIIYELNLFYEQNGYYPEKLGDLIPEYLEELPTSNWGLKRIDYKYELDKSNQFYSIDYKTGTGCGWTYFSSDGWQFYD